MTLIKQAIKNKNKNKNKGVNKSLSNMPKIKNTELKMNTPSRMLIRNRDNKFIKNDNKVTEKTSEEEEINGEEELLNLISNKHDKHGGDVLNINETIKSQEKTDRSSNLQSTRVNKKIMRSRIPRRRPVVTANKLTGFHSVCYYYYYLLYFIKSLVIFTELIYKIGYENCSCQEKFKKNKSTE